MRWRERRRAEIKGNRGRTTTGEGGTGGWGERDPGRYDQWPGEEPKARWPGRIRRRGFGWTRSLAVELGDRWWGERERGGRSRAGLGGVQSWSLQRCRACCKLQLQTPWTVRTERRGQSGQRRRACAAGDGIGRQRVVGSATGLDAGRRRMAEQRDVRPAATVGLGRELQAGGRLRANGPANPSTRRPTLLACAGCAAGGRAGKRWRGGRKVRQAASRRCAARCCAVLRCDAMRGSARSLALPLALVREARRPAVRCLAWARGGKSRGRRLRGGKRARRADWMDGRRRSNQGEARRCWDEVEARAGRENLCHDACLGRWSLLAGRQRDSRRREG